MFKSALVGVDLSPAEKPLLGCLPELKRWGIDAVVLAHVIRIGYVEGAGYGHEDEYSEWLERQAAPLRAAGLDVAVSVTASGAPADELLAVARESEVDLVVVGSRSHSFVHDLFLGSVAKEVARKSGIPVLIERIEATEAGIAGTCAATCQQKLDRLLLATDLSEQSKSAEDAAVYLAAKAGETDSLMVLPDEGSVGFNPEQGEVATGLKGIVTRIEQQGGRGRARIEHGDPADIIARVGQEGYTLIIVGKHGRNWIEDMIIGSTAAKVCEIAKRPVLIVPLRKR